MFIEFGRSERIEYALDRIGVAVIVSGLTPVDPDVEHATLVVQRFDQPWPLVVVGLEQRRVSLLRGHERLERRLCDCPDQKRDYQHEALRLSNPNHRPLSLSAKKKVPSRSQGKRPAIRYGIQHSAL